MKIYVYVDGFNLYNGALRGTAYKWLDLDAFARNLLPNDQIDCIKYFSARVNARAGARDQPLRQMAYWRAMRTLPNLEIIEGHFLSGTKRMPTAASVQQIELQAQQGVNVAGMRPVMTEVFGAEEKGTDVNLATHLVHDAHLGRFDGALVISNDSDLNEAIRLVRQEVGLIVGVFTPHTRRPSVQLQQTASFFRRIRAYHLQASQFPATLQDARGTFSKPTTW